VPCRLGTKRMLETVTRICTGHGREGDIEDLEELGATIKDTALCGLGQTAPNPVLSTLRHFRKEYDEHVMDKRCAAGACTDLMSYFIDEESCKGCTLCKKKCPVEAITGELKQAHAIDQEKCIGCGACYEACRLGAVYRQ
ncbi:MAG: NADH-ubiquinone oxidoreductase-F iron-sulfur binding region domain-containing protein, partial [Planctomycetota bacterium]